MFASSEFCNRPPEFPLCAGIAQFRQLPGYLWGALGTILVSDNREQ